MRVALTDAIADPLGQKLRVFSGSRTEGSLAVSSQSDAPQGLAIPRGSSDQEPGVQLTQPVVVAHVVHPRPHSLQHFRRRRRRKERSIGRRVAKTETRTTRRLDRACPSAGPARIGLSTPATKLRIAPPRRDAQSHFEFRDGPLWAATGPRHAVGKALELLHLRRVEPGSVLLPKRQRCSGLRRRRGTALPRGVGRGRRREAADAGHGSGTLRLHGESLAPPPASSASPPTSYSASGPPRPTATPGTGE